jgi:hypothetical protein
MSFTAVFWAVLYCLGIVAAFLVNPVFAAVGYLLEYYMRPELKWWGDELPVLRYNLIMAMVLGVTFFLHRGHLRELVRVPNPSMRWLIALAVVMMFVTATVAVSPDTSWNWSVQWFKMAFIFPLLLVGVLRTRGTFDAFIAAHMLGAFWWGWDAWNDPQREAGRLINIGSGDTLNDNAASAHLLTVLPFAVVYLLVAKDKRLRAIGLLSLPFVVNTLILCNSRGSMVGLGAALVASIFLVRSGNRLRMAGAAIGMALMVLLLADDPFLTRQQTTANYQEDSSSQQRLESVRGALRLVRDRPLGAGGRGFHLLSPIYIPDIVEAHGGDLRAPHNTWAMVASEWGILGLICYLGIYISAFVVLRRVKRAALFEADSFYYWRALAIQLALIAFLVASTFTDRLYAEAGYWMVSLSYALYRIRLSDVAEAARAPVPVAQPEAPRGAAAMWPVAHAP